MSDFTHTPLAGLFDPAPLNANFDGLKVALNNLDSTFNFSSGKLTNRVFRKAPLTESFGSKSNNEIASFLVALNLSTAAPITGHSPPTSINRYSVVDTGVRFYLPQDAIMAQVDSWCELRKSKAAWMTLASGETLSIDIKAKLYVDGNLERTRRYKWTETEGTLHPHAGEQRGVGAQIQWGSTNLKAGWHTAHLELDFTGTSTTTAVTNLIQQWYGLSRGTSITVTYA